ncbi:hypothetical protein ABPG72_015732 [Tetrahymena utriculariae]
MSNESLGNSSSNLQNNQNEDKVQSVKNLITNLKLQLEQEKMLRQEDLQLLQEEQQKFKESENTIIQLQESIQRQNVSIEQLEYKNEALQRKVDELLVQVNQKKNNAGGIFSGIFNGKQKQMMEQLQSQLQQCEEELQIKTEETERLHEHLYELKKELNSKIEQLNGSIEQYKQVSEQQLQQIKKQEQKEVDFKKSIDGLHNAKKIIEKELENAIKDLQNLKVQYSCDTSSLNRVIGIQKELLDIKIPSFKKQSSNYDSLINMENEKPQQQITLKEKEREVFKMFNAQRDSIKKQYGNALTIFEQKINTLLSNIESSSNTTNTPQSTFTKYKDSASIFNYKINGLKEGLNNIFACIDKIISLEYQISTAKQQNQTIEQIELVEKQDNQKIVLLERLEDSKNLVTTFLSDMQCYFNEEMTLFNILPSQLLQTYQELIASIKDIELIQNYYIQTLQSLVVFNINDAQQFSYLRDNYKNKQNSKDELSQISNKLFAKLNVLFSLLKKKSSQENEIIEQILALSKEQHQQKGESEYLSHNRQNISYKFQLISPNALINENVTLCISLDALRVSLIEIKDLFFNFLNDFSFKDTFILEQFKQQDLIRVVDDYINKINKSIDIHCVLSNQTQIKEMSDTIYDQSEQIKSLHIAIDDQNSNLKSLNSSKTKVEEILSIKIKILDEIKEHLSKQMKNENESNNNLEYILNLVDQEKGTVFYQKSIIQIEQAQSKSRIQDKVNMDKFLKEATNNVAPLEKLLTDEKFNNENDKKALTVFEKSREKLISLLYQNNQLEKRVKDTAAKVDEKEQKIKKYQTEINEYKSQIEKLKINSATSSSNDNNNTTAATANNLIDLL